MNLAVIAADGRSGKQFVEAALERGHTIRAGVRGELPEPKPNLEFIRCDATNFDEVRHLITGQDAVVSLIGHVKNSKPDVQTIAMEQTIKAMQEENISRFVSLTGTGVRFPGDNIPFIDYFLNFGVSKMDPNRVDDGKNFVETVKKSNLNWTIIRVLKLQNIQPQPFSLLPNGPTKWVVGRAEVAKAMLEVLEHNSFIKQAPIIGWKKDG